MIFSIGMEIFFLGASAYYGSYLFLISALFFLLINIVLLVLLKILPGKAIRSTRDDFMKIISIQFGKDQWKRLS